MLQMVKLFLLLQTTSPIPSIIMLLEGIVETGNPIKLPQGMYIVKMKDRVQKVIL